MDREDYQDFQESLEQSGVNAVFGLIMRLLADNPPTEPETIVGTFPGNRTRAMGHALALIETLEEHDVEAEREYIKPHDEFDEHIIAIHIMGGAGADSQEDS